MIVYYAMGGGLGHLTRAKAVLHTLHPKESATILTASPFASDYRVIKPHHVLQVPKTHQKDRLLYLKWLQNAIDKCRPSLLYIDTFAAGIFGELCSLNLSSISLCYIARSLKWQKYQRSITMPLPYVFTKTYLVEFIESKQMHFIKQHSTTVEDLQLNDPPQSICSKTVEELCSIKEPRWLLVHSNESEVAELFSYAKEIALLENISPSWIIIAPKQTIFQLHVYHFDIYPATLVLPHANCIFTAAGFNILRQTSQYRKYQYIYPFPRKFDDQFARAKRARNCQD